MEWSVVTGNAGLLAAATLNTVAIAATTIVLSVVLAFPLALMRDSRVAPLRVIAGIYSWTTRAMPTLALLFLAYYGLPELGIYLDPVPAAVAGLTVSAAGYNMEYIRAALKAVPRGQYEACRALGIPFPLALRRLILPQAMRILLPPLSSNLTLLLKGSALASLVAVNELTGQAMALISDTYRPIEILIVVAVVYLALNGVLVAVQKGVERQFRLPA
ncbi:polar amino acid transport system permease protein/cystine transport system permease protein [Faunimonas pinastri]|uniref:Polar amino acid transport system permease protein/cystine transport system permease protein n=1 Tax=Faunimonas pinastri TaxID=1855383 RepID=A0A1H9E8M2_9HYPH|nr:amino acid ABC transporter permease [Faunimonas pinastri]SEQ21985.1 polar amino acid transport system permease protein/cystine transport system permease protein [Faunimonas pinastri]